MQKQEAINLIENTFNNSFSEEQFTLFIKNLLNNIDLTRTRPWSTLIYDDFKKYISGYRRLGLYTDQNNNEIEVLIVRVIDERHLQKARTSLRNFTIKWLQSENNKSKPRDYALVAYFSKSDNGADWRFSFVKLQYTTEVKEGKLKQSEDPSPAKRFSFLVGEHEKAHTAKKQLLPLLENLNNNPSLKELEEAFSVEKVTDEFFEQYKTLFLKLSDQFELDTNGLKEQLSVAGIDIPRFTKKLLGQIVFLYFLQKKGWLGVSKQGKWGEGDKKYLQNLYKTALENNKNYFGDYLQPLFYKALAHKHNDDGIKGYFSELQCKVPFLNGGLFEADYDWEHDQVTIPNNLFRNSYKVKKTGDTGTGVLDVFDRYNFTIKEDEPLEKEVAVDPEMLGKVFENMLEIKERKSKGAFYTPREIVHYMCQESLIHYLDNAVNTYAKTYREMGDSQTALFGNEIKNGQQSLMQEQDQVLVPKEDIETLIRKGFFTLENDQRVLSEGRETPAYKFKLPESVRLHADLLDEKLMDIKVCDPAIGSGAFPVGMLHELVNAQLVLKQYLSDKYLNEKLVALNLATEEIEKQPEKYNYRLKRHTIQESIYGVDIDASAIDIARLRLWLSLVVDEEDLDNIKALPNLDYKIVCGNSLIGLPPQGADRYPQLKDELEKLKDEFFKETEESAKKRLRKIINDKIEVVLQAAEDFEGYKIDFDFELFFSEVWREKGGFDVVIGNPPYVLLQDEYKDKTSLEFFKNNYLVASYKVDLYHLFFEKAIKIKKSKGSLVYITPTNYQSNNYSKGLRKLLIKNGLSEIIVLEGKVFKASVNTSITHIKYWSQDNKIKFEKAILDSHEDLRIKFTGRLPLSYFNTEDILLIPPLNKEAANIMQKINSMSLSNLESIANVNFGMQLRDRKKFPEDVIETTNVSQLSDYHMPCYTGKDIKAFKLKFQNRYCYFNLEAKRGGCWNENAQLAKDKILIPQIGKYPIGAIDRNGYAVLNTAFMVNIFSDNSSEFILAQINSDICAFYWINKYRDDRDTFPKIKGTYVSKLPFILKENKELVIIIGYIDLLSTIPNYQLQFEYLKTISNGIVFELYFPTEIKSAGKEILKHLDDLKPIKENMSDEEKLAIIQSEFERLHDLNHPVRQAIETLDEVEEVRIIKEALK